MTPLKDKIQDALDESRMLVLGAGCMLRMFLGAWFGRIQQQQRRQVLAWQ